MIFFFFKKKRKHPKTVISTIIRLIFLSVTSCVTPHKKVGNCISIKACNELMWLILNKKSDKKAMSFLRESQCGFENNQPKVCCKIVGPTLLTTSSQARITAGLSKYADCGTNEVTHKIIGGEEVQAGK